MKYNRNKTFWVTQYGERRLVKDLEDSHVQNIVQFLPNSGHASNKALTNFFNKELKIRNLKKIPYQIPHIAPDGKLKSWSADHRTNVAEDELANLNFIRVLVKTEIINEEFYDDLKYDIRFPIAKS